MLNQGHVTQGNLSCNLQRSDDDSKTLQVAEGVSHVRNIDGITRGKFLDQSSGLEMVGDARDCRRDWHFVDFGIPFFPKHSFCSSVPSFIFFLFPSSQ